MLLLLHYCENLLEHCSQVLDVSGGRVIVQTVVKAGRANVDHGDHGGGCNIVLFRELLLVLIQQISPEINIVIPYHLHKVVFQNLPDHHHHGLRVVSVHVLIPESIIGISDRGAVNLAATGEGVVIIAFFNTRLVIYALLNLKEADAFVIGQTIIGNLSEEIWVVGHAEELADMIIRVFFVQLVIIVADSDHLASQRCDHKEGAAVHRGNRVIDDDNLIYHFAVIRLAAHDHMIEIKESDKVPFALAQILVHNDLLAVLIPYQFVDILGTRFLLKLETLKACAGDQTVNILHSLCGIDSLAVQLCNFGLKLPRLFSQFLLFFVFSLPGITIIIGTF
jgi:hypothetical protein